MKITIVGDASSINVRQWSESLSGAGATVDLISFAPAWSPDIEVNRLPQWNDRGPARYLLAAMRARKVLARQRPDVLVGYFVTGYGTTASLTGYRPIVQVTTGSDVLATRRGSLAHRAATRNLTAADLVVAWAPHMATAVRQRGVPAEKIFVQPRGIDTQQIEAARRARRGPPATARVISTRSLSPKYRNHLLLEAMVGVEDASLTLAGHGPERRALERRARDLGLQERVSFAGRVSYGKIPELLVQHGVYAAAVSTDGVSASLLEAMAAGLVPVVPATDANREWVQHGRNGLLFDAPSVSDLAACLRRATEDDALRDRASRENPVAVHARANMAVNATRFIDRFRELV